MDLEDRFSRTRMLFGEDFARLQESSVIIFGVGGVGGYALDALYRVGVGRIVIVDRDTFDVTNQNRQIGSEFVGEKKVEALSRIYKGVEGIFAKVDAGFLEGFDLCAFDVVIDAIDDIPAKVAIAKEAAPRLISAMGSAKRLDLSQIRADSIWKSYGDKFARKFREALKKEGFSGDFRVIFSPEVACCKTLGSFSAVTGAFGLHLASEAVRRILRRK